MKTVWDVIWGMDQREWRAVPRNKVLFFGFVDHRISWLSPLEENDIIKSTRPFKTDHESFIRKPKIVDSLSSVYSSNRTDYEMM